MGKLYVTKHVVTTVPKKELIIVSSIFKKIFYESDNTFVQISQQVIIAMQHRSHFSV